MARSNGEGGVLGLDLWEQTTFPEEKNDPLGFGGIDGKNVSERRRNKELIAVIMQLGTSDKRCKEAIAGWKGDSYGQGKNGQCEVWKKWLGLFG